MELFTNLEPCMMCLGASISSFVGKVCYSLNAPSDGAAKALFKRYIDIHRDSPLVEWGKTLIQ